MTSHWTEPTVHKNTILDSINSLMCEFTNKYNTLLPNIKDSKNLMCFSDYSGEEKEAKYLVYSFLIISGDNLLDWNKLREKLRNDLLSDGRRVSYKNFRDKLSQKFIAEFLEIANELDGYLITISISKNINSIFETNTPLDLSNPDFSKYSEWTKDTLEKTFRVMRFLGLFVAGFSKKNQNLFWITDNDKIAANNERITQLTQLFAYVTTEHLNHNLGHLRVGTTNLDDGTKLIEDLCAIPDFAAGACSDQLKNPEAQYSDKSGKIFWLYSPKFKQKTNNLIWWLSSSNKNLCKLCFRIDKTDEHKNSVSFYHFYNQY